MDSSDGVTVAINDFLGEPVAVGTWLYGGVAPQRAIIVACNFDRAHAMALDEIGYAAEHEVELEPPGDPRALGPDGVFYHVANTTCPDFDTIAEAKAWADNQPWGPVAWDR